jgi:hypothetical protein
MIQTRRFSIALLMAVVFFVAADFAIVRAYWNAPGPEVAVAVTTLPMINLLLLALPRLRAGREDRRFWAGFQVAGWMMVLVFGACNWIFEDDFIAPIVWISQQGWFAPNSPAGLAFNIACGVVIYTLPQLLAAMVGGWLALGYRLVMVRR